MLKLELIALVRRQKAPTPTYALEEMTIGLTLVLMLLGPNNMYAFNFNSYFEAL